MSKTIRTKTLTGGEIPEGWDSFKMLSGAAEICVRSYDRGAR